MSWQHIMEAIWGLLSLAVTGVLFATLCIMYPQGEGRADDE